jgi:hypothetical protein
VPENPADGEGIPPGGDFLVDVRKPGEHAQCVFANTVLLLVVIRQRLARSDRLLAIPNIRLVGKQLFL